MLTKVNYRGVTYLGVTLSTKPQACLGIGFCKSTYEKELNRAARAKSSTPKTEQFYPNTVLTSYCELTDQKVM